MKTGKTRQQITTLILISLLSSTTGSMAKDDPLKTAPKMVLAKALHPKKMEDDRGPGLNSDRAFASTAAQQALERYLAEIEDIERVAAKRKEQARQRLAKTLQQTQLAEVEQGPRYRGMLGSFQDNKGRIPYILLSVPDGSNVYQERMRSAMNGRFELRGPMYRFEARGHVEIPAKGTYRLETGRGYGQFKINGVSYNLSQRKAGQPLRAEVELDQGVQEVYFRIGNNGGQMLSSLVRICDAESGEALPIFAYESEIKTFLDDLSLGVELTETSGWTLEKNRIR